MESVTTPTADRPRPLEPLSSDGSSNTTAALLASHPLNAGGRSRTGRHRARSRTSDVHAGSYSSSPGPSSYFDLPRPANGNDNYPRSPGDGGPSAGSSKASSPREASSDARTPGVTGSGSGFLTIPLSKSTSSQSSRLPSPVSSLPRPRQSSLTLPPSSSQTRAGPTPLQPASSESPSSSSSRSIPLLSNASAGSIFALSSRHGLSSSETSPSRATKPSRRTRRPPLILTRQEEDAINARYDLMTSLEIAEALAPWLGGREPTTSRRFSHPSRVLGEDDDALATEGGTLSSTSQPLFPPSPPGSPDGKEHPLRVLARLTRRFVKLERDGDGGNESAPQPRREFSESEPEPSLQYDLLDALSTSLEPALQSTPTASNLTFRSASPTSISSLPRHTQHSKDGSRKSRTGSVSTMASIASAASSSVLSLSPQDSTPLTKSRTSSLKVEKPASTAPPRKDRASVGEWMGMGGWWGTGPPKACGPAHLSKDAQRSHRRSLRGFLSPPILSPAITTVDSTSAAPETLLFGTSAPSSTLTLGHDSVTPEPDRGSSPHFRAIFLSTRIMSSDPASLFSSKSSAEPHIAQIAFQLVTNARENKIAVREPPSTRPTASLSPRVGDGSSNKPAVPSSPAVITVSGTAALPRGPESSRPSSLAGASSVLSRVLASTTGGDHSRSRSTSNPFTTSSSSPHVMGPAAGRQVVPSIERGEPAMPTTAGLASGGGYPFSPPMPSVELEPIEPSDTKPPSMLFDRSNLKSFFSSPKVDRVSKRASRFQMGVEPLTDRYGFIYDVHNIKMLRDASEAGAAAPACFAGVSSSMVDREEEEEDWVEENILVHRTPAKRNSAAGAEKGDVAVTALPASGLQNSVVSFVSHEAISAEEEEGEDGTSGDPSPAPPEVRKRRHRSSTLVSLAPSPARPSTSEQVIHASGEALTSTTEEELADVVSTSDEQQQQQPRRVGRRGFFNPSSRKTIELLLSHLTALHDSTQAAQKAKWDVFLKKRRTSAIAGAGPAAVDGENLVGFATLGLGTDYAEFVKLVRGGIPIAYRAKVWAECSGAGEVMAPGEYEDLLALADHEGLKSTVRAEIEKDVVRTLPLNVFFGGDGPGVAKLRRLLTAFAWHDMSIGYCQGLNMLAATLLLTHQREEEAFWVFLCIVERLMPPDYYSPSLLCSRADQRVLQDFLALELPKLADHLTSNGVEVAALSFGWFLSLFTDCLPVETLFRCWDVFFVEGFDFFFRLSLAILKMNEQALLQCDFIGDLYECLEACTSRLWNADALLAIEHDLKGTVTHEGIIARRAIHVQALVEEMGDDRPF